MGQIEDVVMNKLWTVIMVACLTASAGAQTADDRPDTRPPRGGPAEAGDADPSGEPMELDLSGAEVGVQVVGDSIIFTGVESDVAILEALVAQLDRDITPKDYRVVRLENRNAQELGQVVQEAAQKMKGRELRPEEEITISTISSNILLVTGPGPDLEMIVDIIEQLDEIPSSLPSVESMTYPLAHIKANKAQVELEELIAALIVRQGDDPANQIIIRAIDASNSLLVLAPKAEHEKIGQLIREIDVEPVKGYGDLKLVYFPLLNSEAAKLADVLNELFQTAEAADEVTETIRRIRMVKGRPGDADALEELPPINLERQIKLIPDEESQALICATAEENIGPLGALIEMLDGVPLAVEQGLRVFPLRYADANGLKELLDDMFEQGKDLPKPAPGDKSSTAVPENPIGKSLVYNVGVTADARTNVLIVTGRNEQLLLVEGIVQKVDVPAMSIKHPLKLITLQQIDATRVSKIIESLWEQRIEAMTATETGEAAIARERIFQSVDLRSNSLIVAGTEENVAEVARIVATLDAAPDRFNDQIRIVNCTQTSAGDLKTKIDELWQRKADLRGEAEQPQDAPVVVADQRSNALVIASSPEDYEEIKRLVDALEAQPLAPIAEIRLLTLINNDATQIGEMLSGLFEERLQQRLAQGQEENPSDRVAVATEPATNTILVASSPDNFAEIERIVKELDVAADLEGVVRFFVLENAQAENVADRIRELFDQGLYTGGVIGDSAINEERQRVALVADPRSNAVVASANKTNLAIIEKLISQMDTDRAPLLNADTRIYQLSFADSVKISGMLDTLFEGMASLTEEFEAPTIVAEPVSNTLIVTGSRDAIKRTTDLVQSLDVTPARQTAIQVYPVRHASAGKLAAKITEVFENRDEGIDTPRTPVLVMPDEPTNAIICSASAEDHSVVNHLLGLLDVPSSISRRVQVFPLKQAKAEGSAEVLEQLFESQAQVGGTEDASGGIVVQADRRTNSLVVWAAETEMANIAQIVEKLDTTVPGPEMMVKVITLRRAIATELAETLTNTLTGGQSGGDDDQAVILIYEDVLPDGSKVTRKLLRQDINMEADERTNSLFVMAPAGSMEMLEGLILSIDRIPPTVAEIRMFPLTNADAEEVVEVLQELFEEQDSQEGPETVLQVDSAVAGAQPSTPGQQLRFTSNRRTNTVIAAGAETDLDMIEAMIRRLDSQDVDERMRFVYEPRYTPATDAQTALRDYFEEENDLLGELDDASSILRQAERHVTVVGDEESNSLLVGVSPRYFSRTMDMLTSLDRPPPQVNIQMLIAEVILDDNLEFGMEWALQDLLFSETVTQGPNGTVRGNNFDFVGGVDVGAAGAAGSFGGFSFAITGEDFGFLLRALQSDGSPRGTESAADHRGEQPGGQHQHR
jgi:type II secretory pathway component GspD/PulD (secretin)